MLIQDKETLLKYAEFTATINFPSLSKTVEFVESSAIKSLLGVELLTRLNEFREEDKDVLHQVRRVMGPLICYHYVPKSEVKIGDAGAQRMETANAKTAFQNQVYNFREQNLREAEMAAESLLEYLDNAGLEEWDDSPSRKDYKSLFIRSGGEFQQAFSSASPYRNYLAMRATISDMQDLHIRPLLEQADYDTLLQRDNLDADQTTLLKTIQKAVAYLTVTAAIPLLNIKIDAAGITVQTSNSAVSDYIQNRRAADPEAMNALILRCQENASVWMKQLKTLLSQKNNDPSETVPEALTPLRATFGLI